jgi:hypothetical protein
MTAESQGTEENSCEKRIEAARWRQTSVEIEKIPSRMAMNQTHIKVNIEMNRQQNGHRNHPVKKTRVKSRQTILSGAEA